jgi:hypothetical protein
MLGRDTSHTRLAAVVRRELAEGASPLSLALDTVQLAAERVALYFTDGGTAPLDEKDLALAVKHFEVRIRACAYSWQESGPPGSPDKL